MPQPNTELLNDLGFKPEAEPIFEEKPEQKVAALEWLPETEGVEMFQETQPFYDPSAPPMPIEQKAKNILSLAQEQKVSLSEAENAINSQEKIKRGFFGRTKKAWQRGGEAVDIDFLWAQVFHGTLSRDEAEARTVEFQELMRSDPIEGRNWAENLWLETVAIAEPMVGGEIKGLTYGGITGLGALAFGQAGPQVAMPEEIVTVPSAAAVGHVYGTLSYWSEQGLGSIYKEGLDAGLDDRTARLVASIGGPIYGAIEFSQVGRLIPGFGNAKRTIVGATLKYLKTIGYEVAEEAEQKVISEGSVLVGKIIDGMIRVSEVGKEIKDIGIKAFNEAKEAIGPMALLALPGGAIEYIGAKAKEAAPAVEKPVETEPVAPEIAEKAPEAPPEVITPVEPIPQTPEDAQRALRIFQMYQETGEEAILEDLPPGAEIKISPEEVSLSLAKTLTTPEKRAEFKENFTKALGMVELGEAEYADLVREAMAYQQAWGDIDPLPAGVLRYTGIEVKKPTEVAPEAEKAAKEVWEMTSQEYKEFNLKALKETGLKGEPEITGHKGKIEYAVKQGKPVPREVLEEYKSEKWAQKAIEAKAPPNWDKESLKLAKETAKTIEKTDLYREAVTGELDELSKLTMGVYFIPEKFRGEVKDAIANYPALKFHLTSDPKRGKHFDEAMEEIGMDKDVYVFLDLLGRTVQKQKKLGKISEKGLDSLITSREPYFEMLAVKYEMLMQGLTPAEINDNLRELAIEYDLSDEDISDLLIGEPYVKKEQRIPERVEEAKRPPIERKIQKGLFAQAVFEPITGEQLTLGIGKGEITPETLRAVTIKDTLRNRVAKILSESKPPDSPQSLYLDRLVDSTELFNNPENPMPEVRTAWNEAVKGRIMPEIKEGGPDPLQQIRLALEKAEKVRPITEAAQKAERKKRVGAAEASLKGFIEKGVPAEQAIYYSTGQLRGPLTEYEGLYQSIRDIVGPDSINQAFLMITNNPDLQYFGVVDTKSAFQKLIDGASLTPREIELIRKQFGLEMGEIAETRLAKSSLYDRLIALWRAGMLTGIKTSGINLYANVSHAISETTKDIPAVAIDNVASLFTGERTLAFTVRGLIGGKIEGFHKGWRYLRTGYDERSIGAKYDYKKINFGTSKFARGLQWYEELFFHLMGAADQPFYYGAKARSLFSQSIAQAKNEGLKGEERRAFVDNLVQNPTDEMLKYAAHDAEVAVFQNRTIPGDIAKAIQKAPGGMIAIPFSRTPAAVAMQIINYSPIGGIKTIVENIGRGKFDQRLFSQGIGRTAVGTGVLYVGFILFQKGLMALDWPDSERERKLWEMEGKKANSIKIDGKWRSAYVLGPVGNVLLIGGHFANGLEETGSPTEAIVISLMGGAKSFSEQTFVRGMNQMAGAIADPERSFDVWFSNLAGSSVPTIVADVARAMDSTERQTKGPIQRIEGRIPVLRETLEPRIDVFGQDLPRYGGNVLEVMVDPTRPTKVKQDTVVDEIRRLWALGIKVTPTLLGDKYGYDILSPHENTVLWRRAGEMTYRNLLNLLYSPQYRKANDEQKGKLINKYTKLAKDVARAEIVNVKLYSGIRPDQLRESGLLTNDVERIRKKLFRLR